MQREKKIDIVKDNKDKQMTYRKQMGRYKKAMDNEFYFEAMLIVYAMLEDRLRSFLYYIGSFRKVEDKGLNVKKTKGTLRTLYFGSEDAASGKRIDMNSISNKETLIRKTIEYVIACDHTPEDSYLKILKQEYEGCIDMDGLLTVLDEIDEWRGYRNEVVHGLLHKNMDSLDQELGEKIENGMSCARFLDSQVKALKRKNLIRKTMKITN